MNSKTILLSITVLMAGAVNADVTTIISAAPASNAGPVFKDTVNLKVEPCVYASRSFGPGDRLVSQDGRIHIVCSATADGAQWFPVGK